MLNRRPKELASARLLAGQEGLRARVDVTDKVDKCMLLMLCDNLLQVLEQSGYLTPNIATARPLIQAQLAEWGFFPTSTSTGG